MNKMDAKCKCLSFTQHQAYEQYNMNLGHIKTILMLHACNAIAIKIFLFEGWRWSGHVFTTTSY